MISIFKIMNFIKYFWVISISLIMTLNCFSQSLLVVEKRHANVKNLKYKVGDRISLKTNKNEIIDGYINKMNDSTIAINYISINLNEIHTIYTERKLVLIFSEIGTKAGAAFVIVDTFNNLTNNDGPIVNPRALKTGGLMIGAGLILHPFIHKKHEINENKWRVRVLQYFNLEGSI